MPANRPSGRSSRPRCRLAGHPPGSGGHARAIDPAIPSSAGTIDLPAVARSIGVDRNYREWINIRQFTIHIVSPEFLLCADCDAIVIASTNSNYIWKICSDFLTCAGLAMES
jgi:hypothetical protein